MSEKCYIELNSNQLCEEYHYDCIYDIAWSMEGEFPQNQTTCCEGDTGGPNWTQCIMF